MKVAHKIREARISQNMTQMNLADAMEVSYQAVSNWERGNSMPDISKLEPLCQILHISMDELLGTESTPRALNHILNKEEASETQDEPITLNEIQELAPILPPSDVERLVDDSLEQQKEEKLDLKAIIGLAPFLSEDTLDELVKASNPETDMDSILALAPFLEEDTMDWLARNRLPAVGLQGLIQLAPFLCEDTLDALVKASNPETDMDGILALAPFLEEDTLDWLVKKMLPVEDLQKLSALMPYLCEDTMEAIALSLDPQKDMESLISFAPSLDEDTLDKVIDKITDFEQADVSGLYPYLSQESLQKIAKALMKTQNLDALKSVISYM